MQIFGLVLIGCELQSSKVTSLSSNLKFATCEARTNQIVTYIEFKAIYMNIESISYHSIVNRYMHNDRTLIFSRITTLYLGVSDS